MKASLPSAGLYAITPDRDYGDGELLAAVEAALRGGAVMLQYRRKTLSRPRALCELDVLIPACERHGALLFVNDDIELAAASGAHGVHLGRDDGDYQALLRAPDRRLLVGVSCYNTLALARNAVTAGADYIAFGSVFPSGTKPAAVHCPLSVIAAARRELGCPIVAIGGITPDNAIEAVEAGANFVAAIEGVFGTADVEANAIRYARAFSF